MDAVQVVYAPGGGWAVKKLHATRAHRRFPDEAVAVEFAKAWATRINLPLYRHRRDGTVRSKDHPPFGVLKL